MSGYVCLVAALFLVRLQLVEPVSTAFLDSYINERLTIEGIIDDEPDVRENTQHIVVRVTEPSKAKIQVALSRYEHYAYGDRVVVTGTLKLPEPFGQETGREFDYPHFLAKDGIGYQMSFAHARVLGHGLGNPVWGFLYSINFVY